METADAIMKRERSSRPSIVTEELIYGKQLAHYPKRQKLVNEQIDIEIQK